MIDTAALATVLSIYVVGVVSPGPNFVAVAHAAVSSSRANALATMAGIVLVNMFWASAAMLGVHLVFEAFPWLALGMRVAGAGYLVWYGVRLIMRARQDIPVAGTAIGMSVPRAFARGVLTNIANPKAIAFFATIFASARPAQVTPPTLVAMVLGVAVVASTWYGFVALVLSHEGMAMVYRRKKAIVDRLCGGLIVALGVRQLAR